MLGDGDFDSVRALWHFYCVSLSNCTHLCSPTRVFCMLSSALEVLSNALTSLDKYVKFSKVCVPLTRNSTISSCPTLGLFEWFVDTVAGLLAHTKCRSDRRRGSQLTL